MQNEVRWFGHLGDGRVASSIRAVFRCKVSVFSKILFSRDVPSSWPALPPSCCTGCCGGSVDAFLSSVVAGDSFPGRSGESCQVVGRGVDGTASRAPVDEITISGFGA